MASRVATRWILAARSSFRPEHYGLEGIGERPVRLYHGTTASFKTFDLSKSRAQLVDNFYGIGLFFTPSKKVARNYANANRNIGFDPEIISDLKRRNAAAGEFLEALYQHGDEAWEMKIEEWGLPQGSSLSGAMDERLGVDANDLNDIAEYIIGSKVAPLGGNDPINIFNTSTGAPEYLYDRLDAIGLDSFEYRPKIYTVEVTVQNPLITASQTQARKARSKGYDSVVYHGPQTVDGVPEVAVFSPRNVKILDVDIA